MAVALCCPVCGFFMADPRTSWRRNGHGHPTPPFPVSVPPRPGERPDMPWPGCVRIVGYNLYASESSNVNMSDQTLKGYDGFFFTSPGDSSPFPVESVRTLETYGRNKWEGSYIPIHAACYDMLAKVLAPCHLDREVLFKLLQSSLYLDYGSSRASLVSYRRRPSLRDYDVCQVSPAPSTELELYYQSLPRPLFRRPPSPEPVKAASHGQDIFSRLPAEILLRIMGALDGSSICRWRRASRPVARVALTNGFWKTVARNDLPWVYDFFLLDSGGPTAVVDWKALFEDLRDGSDMHHARKFNPLANRKRIWNLCCQIKSRYLPLMSELQQRGGLLPDALIGAAPTLPPLPSLLREESTSFTSLSFIKTFGELRHRTPVITMTWALDGDLARLELDLDPSIDGSPYGSLEHAQIPADSWLAGLVVTSRYDSMASTSQMPAHRIVGLKYLYVGHAPVQYGESEGDQRLIHVWPGYFAVGIFFNRSRMTNKVETIALLQQPIAKAPVEAQRRCTMNQEYGAFSFLSTQCMWKDRLPPPEVRGHVAKDALSWGRLNDFWPMETLVFGVSEQQLSEVVALSADFRGRGFQVGYSDGTQSSIGYMSNTIKTLAIDGGGGERIARMAWMIGGGKLNMRFVTNRGRQLAIGWMRDPESHSLKGSEGIVFEGRVLTGFFCWWDYRQEMEVLYPLFMPQSPWEAKGTEAPAYTSLDWKRLHWEPEPLPESKVRASSKLGWMPETHDIPSPGQTTMLTWLDCERPLESVTVLSYHWRTVEATPIASLIFQYSDGEQVAFGPTLDEPPEDETEEDELLTQVWYVDGEKLDSMRVWWGQGRAVNAIRMRSESGLRSPRFGFTLKDSSMSRIRFSGKDAACGIVVGAMSAIIEHKRSGVILSGIQAVEKRC
ncbi:hypothetical protein EDB81DRAFT_874649 [Dactylonectria macrodidyma]|uniref:F-box domain-containing protein n=1 Tax=Dactylonectria macrodidyma TaxID=307937 RepID=A0A9P9JIE2_9HYPO|nr:hypothetical protein EDB81DRAFT_874649 [Dactylonectria macrodidyma]